MSSDRLRLTQEFISDHMNYLPGKEEIVSNSAVDLLAAEAAAESARPDYARGLYDYQIAKARLNAAMGMQP
jgi:hypothetical protein